MSEDAEHCDHCEREVVLLRNSIKAIFETATELGRELRRRDRDEQAIFVIALVVGYVGGLFAGAHIY